MFQYKGYLAIYRQDLDEDRFCGRVQGITDVISFSASNKLEFEKSVDEYLHWSEEDGFIPQQSESNMSVERLPDLKYRGYHATCVREPNHHYRVTVSNTTPTLTWTSASEQLAEWEFYDWVDRQLLVDTPHK